MNKQCNYSVDTSNLVTKEELDKVKGMIEVSARVVGSEIIGGSSSDRSYSLSVSIDYDYIEIYPAFTVNSSSTNYSGYAAVQSSTPIIIAKNGSGRLTMGDSDDIVNVSCDASTIELSCDNYICFYGTVVFYKYDT